VHAVHGNFLLQICSYRHAASADKRSIAQHCIDTFLQATGEIYNSEDAYALLEAYEEGIKAQPKPGKKSNRQNQRTAKLAEAKALADETAERLGSKGTMPDLLNDMNAILIDDLADYWRGFKKSKYVDLYARSRSMEKETVTDDDFHQFRVLGVGGFGAVNAAVKKDTGCLVAIKRMDKKLIKHKNRYKSCYTEQSALKMLSSRFVCGLHYCFQSKDEVCLVLDLLHGGTLSYMLHQKKRISERYTCFFTACIIMAYEALHTKGFVYRDMKPANVLIKDDGYAVLIDFGLAAKVESALKGKCGTRGYWAPEMVKGDQYLFSGDWWSLGVTLVELITGKKPFKKKFQKYKNTEDKIQLCKAGQAEDHIEERNIEAKLGKAQEEDHDGRDSNDEETDEEEEGEKADSKRRASVRVIGGFDKTVESTVETEVALDFCETCLKENEKLRPFGAENAALEGGMARLCKILSICTFAPEVEMILEGDFATFFFLVLQGTVRDSEGTAHGPGSVIGHEGLFHDNYRRSSKYSGGPMGGSVGIMLYSEMGRAHAFDEQVTSELKKLLVATHGGDEAKEAETLQARIDDFGDVEEQKEAHPEERFIAGLAHTAKGAAETDDAEKAKALSNSKQRDQKIYLTQEVWAKKELISKDCGKFLNELLTRNVNERLGCGPSMKQNFSRIKGHDFFKSTFRLEESSSSGSTFWERLEGGNMPAPYIPKKEVNAKEEGKMKTFNTAGMKKLNKEDQEKWADWDWCSSDYFKDEMATYLCEQWHQTDSKKGRIGGGGGGGSGGGGGCCELS